MAMSVLSTRVDPGPEIFYTPQWRLIVESHLTWLRVGRQSEIVVIEPHLAYKYEGDLYGAMTDLKIPPYMHWTVMRVNGLFSPTAFLGEQTTLMVPSRETLQQLAALAGTTQRKIA